MSTLLFDRVRKKPTHFQLSVPPNCFFEVNDAEDPWIFPHHFDYIHGRALGSCFKSHLEVIKSAASFLRPGGYLEFQDFIIPVHRCVDDTVIGTHFERWNTLMLEATAALGKDWSRAGKYKEYFEEMGLVDVVELKYNWPVGKWARGEKEKTLGTWYKENLLSGLQGFTIAALTRGLGMDSVEVELLLAGVRSDINSTKLHSRFLPALLSSPKKFQDGGDSSPLSDTIPFSSCHLVTF